MCPIEKQIVEYQARISRKDEKLRSIIKITTAITNSMKLCPELKELIDTIRRICDD